MDWLVVILVVTALAMIGVISLIHRGRVRIWSICMILLGLGIGILLYTQISIFKSWQTALYIVFSVMLALVLVYLFVTLGTRRQQKSAKMEKNPEDGDVLTTASREPMRLSDWEAVVSYSAAPAKANKEIHRVNANNTPEAPAPVSFSSATFTADEKADVNKTENEELAADAIASFFRENTQLPASAIRMDAAVRPKTANGKAEERKTYPDPVRVSPAAKAAVTAAPTVEKEEEEAFESLSFRVVRDKFADLQKKPEPAAEPKTAVTKDVCVADKEKDAPPPVYKVYHKAQATIAQTPDIAPEQDEAASPVLLTLNPDVSNEAAAEDILAQPESKHTLLPAFAEETAVPVPNEPQEAVSEPLAEVQAEEPEETAVSFPAVVELPEEPAAYITAEPVVIVSEPIEEPIPADKPEPIEELESVTAPEPIKEPEPVAAPEPFEGPEPVAAPEPIEEPEPIEGPESVAAPEPIEEPEPVKEEAPAAELSVKVTEPEAVAAEIAPPAVEETPSLPEQNGLQAQFEAGTAKLNALIAAKEYRDAQALIFDLLRVEYEPTEEEKRRLLLVMKLLKEKEKTADARNR